MKDQRLERWADVLVNYSLEAKKNERAFIFAEVSALPLLEACYRKFLEAGVHTEFTLYPDHFQEIFFSSASDAQLKNTPAVPLYIAKNFDISLRIYSFPNAQLLTNVPLEKQTLVSKAREPVLNAMLGRSEHRWCRTHYPVPGMAQNAGMGTVEYEEFVFTAGYLDEEDPVSKWKEIEKKHKKIIDQLTPIKELHFQNHQGTNLRVNVEGMTWVNSCGKRNFPDGEVFTGPNLNAQNGGVNGIARLSLPTFYNNVEVDEIELTFKKGAVVDAKASKNQDFLHSMIAQDEGAKFVGEIAIGTNERIQKGSKDILFDEKIGGTFHFALGKGYPETGNTNQSALHWDMIFDLRQGGQISGDGEVIYRDGKFLK